MRIPLDLAEHCIETAVRTRYNRKVAQCLGNPSLLDREEAEIQGLKDALETLDFGALRTARPELRGGGGDRICLVLLPGGGFAVDINGDPVPGIER